jgi:hypothetical protein
MNLYVIRKGGILFRLNDELLLEPATRQYRAMLFDDYEFARNAIRRTVNFETRLGLPLLPGFVIEPLEF